MDAVHTIERARRAGNYELMEKEAALLLAPLDTTLRSFQIRSRVVYELHMAALQQYKADPFRPRALLDKSLDLAYRSVDDAVRGCDHVGRLFAEVNIGGEILPELKMWWTATNMLKRATDEAPRYLSGNPENDGRVTRVLMNCHRHRMLNAIAMGERVEARAMRNQLVLNLIFQREYAEGAQWTKDDLAAAKRFFGE